MSKNYDIRKVRLTLHSNGFPKGFILKREPTVRETMYILQKIFYFANEDYKEWFDYKEDIEDYKQECKRVLSEFLKGDADWWRLCEETHCYDDDCVGFTFSAAFPLACYLKKKGIILHI